MAKVHSAGRNRAVIIHSATGRHLAELEAKFSDVGLVQDDGTNPAQASTNYKIMLGPRLGDLRGLWLARKYAGRGEQALFASHRRSFRRPSKGLPALQKPVQQSPNMCRAISLFRDRRALFLFPTASIPCGRVNRRGDSRAANRSGLHMRLELCNKLGQPHGASTIPVGRARLQRSGTPTTVRGPRHHLASFCREARASAGWSSAGKCRVDGSAGTVRTSDRGTLAPPHASHSPPPPLPPTPADPPPSRTSRPAARRGGRARHQGIRPPGSFGFTLIHVRFADPKHGGRR